MVATLRLPDSAPFSPGQRAWLDGLIAGLLAAATGPTVHPPAASEDFPWHDPALPLDDRLTLAAGEPPARRLMAAMAQLDCGQCGYLCRSYAEAIAGGAETDLGRCLPGGKATSRKLRELLAAAPLPPVLAAAAMAAAAPAAALDAATFCRARCLNGPGSEKETRHIVLETEVAAAHEVGDSLGVVARNCPELVAALIAQLGAAPDTPVLSPDGVERPLAEALDRCCEIRRVTDQAVEVLASRARDRSESRVLQAMAEGYPGAGPEDADLLDLLETFPSARPPLSELVSALAPLRPRLYSIASSPKQSPREIHLAVAAVRYERHGRRRGGVASTFLADRLAVGETVSVFVHRAPHFRLPASPDVPVVMIGAGTGIAPFRAFLQERRTLGARGRNWLVFGNPRRRTDFLFEEELAAHHRDGLLTRLDTAFSRDQQSKVYVQHRLLEHAAELWSWLEDGACLYLCGDAQRLARDVEAGLAYIIAREGGMNQAAARAWLARLAAAGRWQKDVY